MRASDLPRCIGLSRLTTGFQRSSPGDRRSHGRLAKPNGESRGYPTSRADAIVAQTAATRPRPVLVGGNRGLRSCHACDLRAFTL
jgi:hypothetical protein